MAAQKVRQKLRTQNFNCSSEELQTLIERHSVVAVHVVETVKRHDPFCGGPTRLALLTVPKLLATPGFDVNKHTIPESYFDYLRNQPPHPLELPPEEVGEIVKMVEDIQAATKLKHGEMIREALSQRSAKRMEEMMQTFYPQQAYDDAWKPPGDKSWD